MQTSPSIAAIAKALAEFQGEATNPSKDATAEVGKYRYNYATLPAIITAVRPLLKKHRLAVVQSAVNANGGVGVQTLLTHDSGEWIMSDPLILPLQAATPQGAGSAVTYARRYALSAILGISSDDDDDGELATEQTRNAPHASAQGAPRPAATSLPAPNSPPSVGTHASTSAGQAGTKAAPRTAKPLTLPYGRSKGKTLEEAAFDDLTWFHGTLTDDKLADEQYGEANRKLKQAIEDELDRRQADQTTDMGERVPPPAADVPFGGDA